MGSNFNSFELLYEQISSLFDRESSGMSGNHLLTRLGRISSESEKTRNSARR